VSRFARATDAARFAAQHLEASPPRPAVLGRWATEHWAALQKRRGCTGDIRGWESSPGKNDGKNDGTWWKNHEKYGKKMKKGWNIVRHSDLSDENYGKIGQQGMENCDLSYESLGGFSDLA
jgi:hypothetical protein